VNPLNPLPQLDRRHAGIDRRGEQGRPSVKGKLEVHRALISSGPIDERFNEAPQVISIRWQRPRYRLQAERLILE
jgi:hypothetical protein